MIRFNDEGDERDDVLAGQTDGELVEPDDLEPDEAGDGEPISFTFFTADDEAVATLRRLLDEVDVTYQLGNDELRAPADAEDAVDAALDHLDRLLGIAPEPGASLEPVHLDWDNTSLDRLEAELRRARVSHRWDDEGVLMVTEADIDDAEAIIGSIEAELGLDLDDEIESADPELLGNLFVTVDRLADDPRSVDHQVELGGLADLAVDSPPPFGLERRVWRDVVRSVEAICTEIELPVPDDDSIRNQAQVLRDKLRPLV